MTTLIEIFIINNFALFIDFCCWLLKLFCMMENFLNDLN